MTAREMVVAEPSSAQMHGWLGRNLGARGETEEAIACWQRAVELDPTNPDYRGELAYARRPLLRLLPKRLSRSLLRLMRKPRGL